MTAIVKKWMGLLLALTVIFAGTIIASADLEAIERYVKDGEWGSWFYAIKSTESSGVYFELSSSGTLKIERDTEGTPNENLYMRLSSFKMIDNPYGSGKIEVTGEEYLTGYGNIVNGSVIFEQKMPKGKYYFLMMNSSTKYRWTFTPDKNSTSTPSTPSTSTDGSITVAAKTIPLQIKKSVDISKIVKTAKGNDIVSISSSDEKVVTVAGTKLKATKKTGTAVITVTTSQGGASFTVKVQKTAVKPSKVIINSDKEVKLVKGSKSTILATVTPVTSSQKLTYKTSNKKVATVSSKGVITAKKAGKAKITVKAGSKKAVVNVIVE